jgi:phosphoribosylglycinamide formyltransferase-1
LTPAPKIAVFVSGGGRSLENLANEIAGGRLDARIAVIVSSTPKAFALERAARLGIPTVVIDPDRKLASASGTAQFSRDAFVAAESFGAELVVLAGFLRLLVIPDAWLGRVINIHPALLPSFGGKGMYGHRVHEAVIASGAMRSGCTVHYVTNEYDAGPILLQREVDVRADDTADSLAERVFEEEKRALPEAVRMHLAGHADALRARRLCRGT